MGLLANRGERERVCFPLLPTRQEVVLHSSKTFSRPNHVAAWRHADWLAGAFKRASISPTGYEILSSSSALIAFFHSRRAYCFFFLQSHHRPSTAHFHVAPRPHPPVPSVQPPAPGELCLYFSRLFLQMSDSVPALRLSIQRVREWGTCGAGRGTYCFGGVWERVGERRGGGERERESRAVIMCRKAEY